MEVVNELTTSYVTVTFLNKSGVAEAPASATWEAIDLKTGTVLQVETALSAAATVEITVAGPTINRIVDDTLAEEVRRITVKGTYNSTDKVTGQYDYKVKNLSRVT